MTVFAVIPVHDNWQYTIQCLEQLRRQVYHPMRVVVVDDGSTDDTAEQLGRCYQEVKVLMGDGTLWWAGAMNRGVEYVLGQARDGDMVLSLNNDVEFDEHYVGRLAETSIRHGRALVGSVGVRSDTGTLIIQGQRFDWPRAQWYRSQADLRDGVDAMVLSRLDCLDGRGLLIPVEVFQEIGLFAAHRLPHYGADKEFTYRAKQAGFPLRLALEAKVVVHTNTDTTGVHYSEADTIPLSQAWRVLTSRRSTNQLQKGWRFIDLCCPSEYRWRNKVMYARLAAGRSFGRTRAGTLISAWLR